MPVSKNRKKHDQAIARRKRNLKSGLINQQINALEEIYLRIFHPEKIEERNKLREEFTEMMNKYNEELKAKKEGETTA